MGELLVVRGVLVWGAVAAVPAAGLAWALRGADAAVSVAIAVAIVMANALVAAAISGFAGRKGAMGAAMAAMPSFAFRMLAIFGALAALKGASFVDEEAFALTFGLAVAVAIALEARSWKRQPWLAMTLTKEKP